MGVVYCAAQRRLPSRPAQATNSYATICQTGVRRLHGAHVVSRKVVGSSMVNLMPHAMTDALSRAN
jgi:hypothetical protein